MSTPEPLWRKSGYSGGDEGECVEVADLAGTIGIRDSKNPTAGHLTLTAEWFAVLLARMKSQP